MMASFPNELLCVVAALVLWTSVGWIINRRLAFQPSLVLPFAPIVGWAAQSVVSLVLSSATSFSSVTVLASAFSFIVALLLPRRRVGAFDRMNGSGEGAGPPSLPYWIYFVAAVLALLPAAAVVPKFV